MRKKDMLEQNYTLAQKVQSLEFENEGLKHRIKEAEQEIERLKNMIFTLGVSGAKNSEPVLTAPAAAPAQVDAEPDDTPAPAAAPHEVAVPKPSVTEPEYEYEDEDEDEDEDENDLLDFGDQPIPSTPASDVDYGASVIGKIVVSAANYSNRLTAGGETKYRELVNLILGRTEVAKADILSAVTSDNGFDTKKAAIDLVYEQACEYFESVMAQIPDLDL